MKTTQPFWIKERHNPQTGVYYVGCGQLSKTAARKQEKALYGDNFMHEYPSEKAYNAKLEELRKKGAMVQ